MYDFINTLEEQHPSWKPESFDRTYRIRRCAQKLLIAAHKPLIAQPLAAIDAALIAIDDGSHREISATRLTTVVLSLRIGRRGDCTPDLQKETTDQSLRVA
jgi:hypothetical protein